MRHPDALVHRPRGHDAVYPVGQRRNDDHASRGEIQDDLIGGQRPTAQVHVGQYERLAVAVAPERDLRLLANRAVHAVAAHKIARPDAAAVVERGGHADSILGDGLQHARSLHRSAERSQAFEQNLLRDGLRDHQRIGIARWQFAEVDGHQHAVAVADRESVGRDSTRHEFGCDAERLEHLEGTCVNHCSARCVVACRLTIDHGTPDAAKRECARERESGRTGAHDEYIDGGLRRQRLGGVGHFDLQIQRVLTLLGRSWENVNAC